MKLDIYTSISNQFKPEGDIVDNFICGFFGQAGYDVELRRFKGGTYPSKKKVVGYPDVLIVHIDKEGTKVGKGSSEEKDYAINSGIPVLLASTDEIYRFKSQQNTNENDWRRYTELRGKVLTPGALKSYLRGLGISPNSAGEVDPFIEDDSDHQKGSDRNMLL